MHATLQLPLSTQFLTDNEKQTTNWRAPWKSWISSTTMKLRRSLVKPVTRQNISSYSVLPPEIIMLDAFNVILWTSASIHIVVHDDLGWKNRTTRYILPRHWLYEWSSQFRSRGTYSVLSRRTEETTFQFFVVATLCDNPVQRYYLHPYWPSWPWLKFN